MSSSVLYLDKPSLPHALHSRRGAATVTILATAFPSLGQESREGQNDDETIVLGPPRLLWSLLLVFALLMPAASIEAQVNPQSLVWAQNFESLSTGTLTSSSYGTSGVDGFNTSFSGNQSDLNNPRRPVAVSNRTYAGNRALRFFIPGNTSGGDSSSYRSEIAANHNGRNQPGWQNREHYVGYAVYLDESWPVTQGTAVVPTVVGQLHGGEGEPGVSPVWHIAARPEGTWRLEQKFKNHQTGQNVTTATAFAQNPSLAADRGRWVRIVVYAKFHGSCGIIRVWKDDVLEAERTCVQTYDSLNVNFGYYKFGLYASGLQSSSGGDRVAYIDEIRVADVALGGNYATVNPANWGGGGIAHRAASSANSGSSAVTSLSVAKPTGVQTGDFMLAAISSNGGYTQTAPANWTFVRENYDGVKTRIYRKVYAGEAGPYQWTLSSSQKMAGSIVAFSGVNATTPIQGHAGANEGSSNVTAHATPSLVTTGNSTWLVAVFGDRSGTGSTWTQPSGMLERADTTTTGSGAISVSVHTQGPVAAGSYAKTGTASIASQYATMQIVAIQP